MFTNSASTLNVSLCICYKGSNALFLTYCTYKYVRVIHTYCIFLREIWQSMGCHLLIYSLNSGHEGYPIIVNFSIFETSFEMRCRRPNRRRATRIIPRYPQKLIRKKRNHDQLYCTWHKFDSSHLSLVWRMCFRIVIDRGFFRRESCLGHFHLMISNRTLSDLLNVCWIQ